MRTTVVVVSDDGKDPASGGGGRVVGTATWSRAFVWQRVVALASGLNSRFLPSLTRHSAVPVVTILEVYAYSGDYDP